MDVRLALSDGGCVGEYSLTLSPSDDPTERSLSFCSEFSIPPGPSLSVRRVLGSVFTLARDCRPAQTNSQHHSPQSSARDWAVALRFANLRWSPPDFSKIFSATSSSVTSSQRSAPTVSDTLWESYQSSVSSGCCDAVFEVEDSCALSLGVVREGRRSAVEQARARQAREMAVAANRQTQEHVGSIVAVHIAELEAVERSWQEKEEQTLEEFTRQYIDALTEASSTVTTTLMTTPPRSQSFVPDPVPQTTPRQHTAVGGSSTLTTRGRLLTGSVKTLASKFLHRAGSVSSESAVGSGSGSSYDPTPSPEAGASSSPAPTREPLSLFAGQGQLKTLYRVEVVSGIALFPSMFSTSCGADPRRRERTASRLYGTELCAVVLPFGLSQTALSVEEGGSEYLMQLQAQCGVSHDFHFGSLASQLREASKHGQENPPLKPGDIVVTRHSNVLDLHVAFHLCVDRKDALGLSEATSFGRANSTTLQGLWSVLSLCATHGVSDLTIPVPVVPDPSLALRQPVDACNLTDSAYVKHGEAVLRTLKSFLAAHAPDTLKRITLVYPVDRPASLCMRFRNWF